MFYEKEFFLRFIKEKADSIEFLPFHKVSKKDMLEIFVNVGFSQINFILAALDFQFTEIFINTLCVSCFDFPWIELDYLSGLQVDKLVGFVAESEFPFLFVVGDMKKENLMFIIP